MPTINTNVAAIKARSNLDKVQRDMDTSIARFFFFLLFYIGDVDFAGDTATTGPRKALIVTSLDNDELTAGSSVMLADTAAVTTDADLSLIHI